MNEQQFWKVIDELAPLGHRKIREIEHDIIDRELFCPDLPFIPYICEKHKLSAEQCLIISRNAREHECSNTIWKNVAYGDDQDEEA